MSRSNQPKQHDQYEWGPWLYEGMPEIGDYIQIRAEHKTTHIEKTFEGMVLRIESTFVILSTQEDNNWDAITYRKRIVRLDSDQSEQSDNQKVIEHV